MAGEDSDSDIECVYVSESNSSKPRKQPSEEAITIGDSPLPDSKNLIRRDKRSSRRSPSPDDPPAAREDWEILFGSGCKSASQSFFRNHNDSLEQVNPADQPILLGSDESDVDIVCIQDASFSERQKKSGGSSELDCVEIRDDEKPSTSRSDENNILQTVDVSLLSIYSQPSPSKRKTTEDEIEPTTSSSNALNYSFENYMPNDFPDDYEPYNQFNSCEAPSSSQNGLADISMHSFDKEEVAVPKKKKISKKSTEEGNEDDAKEVKLLEKEKKKAEKEKEAERKKKERGDKAQSRMEAKHQKETEKLKKLALKEAYRPMQGGKRSLEVRPYEAVDFVELS